MAAAAAAPVALLRDPPAQGQDEYLFSLAAAHEKLGQLDLAWDVAVKALQPRSFPSHLPTLQLAARVSARLGGKGKEGMELGERAVAEAEASGAGERETRRAQHMLGVNLLLESRKESSFELRQELLERSVQNLPSATGGTDASPEFLLDLSLALAETQQTEEALAAAKRALQAGGHSSAYTWQLLALFLSALRRLKDAEEMCKIGIQSVPWPRNVQLQRVLGSVQMEAGDYSGALETYTSLLQLVQQNRQESAVSEGEVWLMLASVYIHAQRLSDACACVNKARALGGDGSAAFFSVLGDLCIAKGNKRSAKGAFEQACVLGPSGSSSSSRVKLAELLLEDGESHAHVARVVLRSALAYDALDHACWFHLGRASLVAGDVEYAEQCFKRSRFLGAQAPALPYCTVAPSPCLPHGTI